MSWHMPDPDYVCSESELTSCDISSSGDDIGQNADTEEGVTEMTPLRTRCCPSKERYFLEAESSLHHLFAH